MNKSHLILALTRVLSTRKESLDAVNKVFTEISAALSRGERVTIAGFGSFHPYIAKARIVVNPSTKQKISVPPKRKIRFIPSKDLI